MRFQDLEGGKCEESMAGVCAGVRNRGCEDWAGSTQGATVGVIGAGKGERVRAEKKVPKAGGEDRVKHEYARRDTTSRCFYSKRAHSAHLNKTFTLLT